MDFVVRRMVDWRCSYLAQPHWGCFAWGSKLPETSAWRADLYYAWTTSNENLARLVCKRVGRGQGWQLVDVVPKFDATKRPRMAVGVIVERPQPGDLATIACTRISTSSVWSLIDRQGFTYADVVRAFDSLEVDDVDAAVRFERSRRRDALMRESERRACG